MPKVQVPTGIISTYSTIFKILWVAASNPWQFTLRDIQIQVCNPRDNSKLKRLVLSLICPSSSSRMKLFVIVAVLLSLGLAQDQPRYSCPEEFVTFRGDTISSITGVLSWEDCGVS